MVVDNSADEGVEALVDYALAFNEFGGSVGCGVLQLLVETCLPRSASGRVVEFGFGLVASGLPKTPLSDFILREWVLLQVSQARTPVYFLRAIGNDVAVSVSKDFFSVDRSVFGHRSVEVFDREM